MRLIAALLPTARRLIPSADRGLAIGLVVFILAIEFAGYFATNEFHDLLAATAFVAMILLVQAYHRQRPLAWLSALEARFHRLTERLAQLKYEVGIDFRGTPPIPCKLPKLVPIFLTSMLAWIGLGIAAWSIFPQGWRAVGMQVSYTLYVVFALVLWISLMTAVAGATLLPVYFLDQRLRTWERERRPRPPDPVVMVGYLLLAGLVACVIPPAYPSLILVVSLAVGLILAIQPAAGGTALLWRASPKAIYSIPLRRLAALAVIILSLDLLGLILWACGGNLWTAPNLNSPMPLTAYLGALVAWLLPGVAAVAAILWWELWRSDPNRRFPPIVHVDGCTAAAVAAIRRWGFRVARGPRLPEHVGLCIVPSNASEAREFNPVWPLKVAEADLTGTLVRDRVVRRDELQLRRQFFRALGRLIKSARAAAPAPKGGYFIAPQYWFITGILWADSESATDHDDDTLKPLGPPFRSVIPVRARQYMARVLRDTQVDAIYLEEGIDHRKVESVLRAVLEVHDIHGGRRRVEDHHFHGIRKVRVIIHDYQPGLPFAHSNYPEPRFDEISRSRILHIFKDRGDSEEQLESPFDFSWEPMPMGAE